MYQFVNPYFDTVPYVKDIVKDYDNHVRNEYYQPLLNHIVELEKQVEYLKSELERYKQNY